MKNEEIVNVRVLDASRAAVFDAFRDPVRLERWWGPAGFTNTMRELDLRPGGRWRITMHGPDGDYQNESVFEEVVENERIVLRHLEPAHFFRLTVSFEDAPDGRTKLTWRMLNEEPPAEDFAAFLHQANEQNLHRLERELARKNGGALDLGPCR